MRWCRLYSEFATDPKVQIMPEAMQRRLIMLFCFHSEGCLEGMDDETLGFAMHLNTAELQKTKELFVKKGFLEGDSWIPRNWEKRQRVSDDGNQRVKRYRERKQRVSNGSVTLQKLNVVGGCNEAVLRAPARSPAPSPSLSVSVSVSEGSPEGAKLLAHSTDSPAAQKVRDDAVRRWGAIDIDAGMQANELIRTWGATLAGHGLDKSFLKLGARERPWAYANTICRGGMPESAGGSSVTGINGSSNTITPSQRAKAETAPPPADPLKLRSDLAELEAIPKPKPWETAQADAIREALTKIPEVNP